MASNSEKIIELKKNIIQTKNELTEITTLKEPLPEFINTTNMLRTNEYLQKSNEKKSELITAYEKYVTELETLVLDIAKIKDKINKLKSNLTTNKKSKKKMRKKSKQRRKIRKRKSSSRRNKTRKKRR